MTQEELKECIDEQQNFINTLGASDYNKREEEEHKRDIAKQEEVIQRKKEAYIQSIKDNKEWIKKSKKKLKRVKDNIEQDIKFKEIMQSRLKMIEDIKEDLRKDPNHFK